MYHSTDSWDMTLILSNNLKLTFTEGVEHTLDLVSVRLHLLHRYLNLLTEEHTILQDEKRLKEQLEALEREEKAKFAVLSSAGIVASITFYRQHRNVKILRY